jgi:PKD repeat protein
MKQFTLRRAAALAVTGLIAAGCTMKDQDAPDFTGPSEFGTSISIAIAPDILQQDGVSQSVVTVTARGANSAPVANVPLRAEIVVNGTPTDFGSLSARNLVTGGDGRATLTYTAPPAVAGVAVDSFTIVDIGITPVGSNYANSATRFASLRLVPTGVVAPPAGLRPAFTFTPATPLDNQAVLFDASTSQAPANNPIASYQWDFGDGDRGTGRTTSHDFDTPGTYIVTLTIADSLGRTASTSQSVTVEAGLSPTASFTYSPTAAAVNQVINFNALSSVPAPGRRIVSYSWDYGDGTGDGGAQVAHRYGRAGTYVVTLIVKDDAGRVGTTSTQVTVSP